jgi:hypothetical protein
MKYSNKTVSLDLREGSIKDAIAYYSRQFEKEENVLTGLVTGPEDCWQFAVLIFIASQVFRQTDNDIQKLLGEFPKPPS